MTTVTTQVHFKVSGRGRKQLRSGPAAARAPVGRVPRVARLMALAIRCEGLIESGAVANQADLAGLGHVTRARVTQIMNMLHLAPDIQEEVLHLPRVSKGRDSITERDLRPISKEWDWNRQRTMWNQLNTDSTPKI